MSCVVLNSPCWCVVEFQQLHHKHFNTCSPLFSGSCQRAPCPWPALLHRHPPLATSAGPWRPTWTPRTLTRTRAGCTIPPWGEWHWGAHPLLAAANGKTRFGMGGALSPIATCPARAPASSAPPMALSWLTPTLFESWLQLRSPWVAPVCQVWFAWNYKCPIC